MAEVNSRSALGDSQLNAVLDGLVADLATVRTAVNTAVSKLNADGGVSDADYAQITTLATTTD